MSRRRGSSRVWWLVLLGLALFQLGAAAAQPPAATPGTSPNVQTLGSVQLSLPLQESLLRLQDQWLVWHSAFLQGDRRLAESLVDDLLRTAEELGFERIPELANGVLVRAVEAARDGDTERAGWALDMAEKLDPGRPEIEFARSRVSWVSGAYLRAGVEQARGYVLTFSVRHLRRAWLSQAFVWLLVSLLVTSVLFVALQMAIKGERVMRGLVSALAVPLPLPIAYVVAAALLIWPFLVAEGWAWLLLFWCVLLWGYASSSERWVLIGSLLLFGLAPAVIAWQTSTQSTSSGEREAERFASRIEEGRLYGQLLADAEQLEQSLPSSPAVAQLIGDLHVGLGQDHLARPRYQEVVRQEGGNGPALNNLGVFHFHRAEYVRAIEYFDRAVKSDDSRLEASYNLSSTYRRLLEFDHSDSSLSSARDIDSRAVSGWILAEKPVVASSGGIARVPQIRRQLGPQPNAVRGNWNRWVRSMPLMLVVLLAGIALHRVGFGTSSGWRQPPDDQHSLLGRSVRRWIPGLVSVEAGDGGRALVALLIPVGALLVPLVRLFGVTVPWAYQPGATAAWSLSGLTLLVFLASRVVIR